MESYVRDILPTQKLDSKELDELNAEADSGVIDEQSTYGDDTAHDDYNPEYDQDAAVWAQ